MESLKKQRSTLKGSMTKLLTYARSNLENATLDDILVKQDRAQKLLSEFQNIEREIFDLDHQVESDLPGFEDTYYSVVAGLNGTIRKRSLTSTKIDNTMMNNSQQPTIEARLPKINIPTFEGNYMEWQSFFDIYSSTIHNRDNLTAAQKFQYLRGLLRGEAAALIRHLSVTDASYNEAFQKLIQRYDRKRYAVNAFIKNYMDQPSITQPNSANIRKLTDALDESLRGLKALGPDAEKRDPWLINIALNKLDNDTKSLWAQETAENDLPTIDELFTFLGRRIDMMESIKGYSKKITTARPSVTRTYSVEAAPEIVCPICKQIGHRIYVCDVYKSMPPSDKSETIQRNNRCFNCLNGGHRVHECRSRSRCQHCHRKHHTSLHGSADGSKAFTEVQQAGSRVHKADLSTVNEATEIKGEKETKTYTVRPVVSHGILPTALIKIQDGNGQWQTFRALLDSASQSSFISEACMQELGLNRENARILVKGLGEAGMRTTRGSTEVTISSMDHTTTMKTQAFIIPKVSSTTIEFNLSPVDCQMLNELQLADPNYSKRGHIDVLLGVDIFFKVMESKRRKLASGLTAVSTSFGWIVAGRIAEENQNISMTKNFNVLLDIDKTLRNFWEIEELPRVTRRTPEEDKCEELFQSTTRRGEDNKFIVKLPFKQSGHMLGTTYNAALNRLKTMEKKFERDVEFGRLYRAFMSEYEELGHMKQVPGHNKTNAYFLPHHGILKASSTTTKLRVVFDASTKSSTGLSLNDILMVGPTVQSPLINIIIRFRQHKFVLCGDVEKMYRQVWVDIEDQQYQNILWRTNAHHQPSTYKLKTLTYGTAAAAFLSTRSLKEIGIKLQSTQPEVAQVILQDMYVDDMMTGASSIAQVKILLQQVTNALGSYGFPLRKFLTNNEELRSFIKTTKEKQTKEIGEHTDTPKVLGLQWDPYEDTFKFTVQLPNRDQHTKRTLLSDASRNFDPLGWLTPIVIRVKILFQNLWIQNLSWDEELPPNILKQWMTVRNDIIEAASLRIPRWLQSSNQVSLIGFSDASEHAYAAVVYGLVETSEGLKASIIASKSRVAPVKQISLPRLELMGALLLTNLMKLVEESLTLEISRTILFTDSQIVLDWLSAHPRRWTTFVANRVSEIMQLYKREHWWHVASKDNPADIASRGMSTMELAKSKLWWSGPDWLEDADQMRIIQTTNAQTQRITNEELRPSKMDTFVVSMNNFLHNFVSKYSSFVKMTKILSIIMRYFNNLRNKIKHIPVKILSNREEIEVAETTLIREIQRVEFSTEVDVLQNKGTLPRHSKLITLNPFLDERGVIRVGGRIQNSLATFNVKHPIILPSNHHAVKCLVRDAHVFHNHPGVSLLTSIIRRRFWIIRGKIISRAIVHKCIKCIKYNPKAENQLMGNLPPERVQYAHPFYKVGVDYCGPFKVQPIRKRGQIPVKVYVCIFVCLCTKAVHIEMVGNLTTESFLAALTRFISRRGSCHTICSDNGTNFVGSNNHLKELFRFLKAKSSDISLALLRYQINWKFIPPGAPHMGGIWEAAVKQAKIHLGKVVGESILTLEEFSTLLTKVEAIMNSRPLAVTQAEDIDCITPAHFLIGRTFTDIADENVIEHNISPMARWKLVKQMQQHFWNRWHRDYLTVLQKKCKWTSEAGNLTSGDIVLVSETGLASTCWALGKIVQTYPGNDGKIRIVDIRLANSNKIVQRPIHKLCKLPIQSYESADSWPAEC